MLGKVLALVLVAAAYGALSLIGSVLVGAVTLQARGAEAFPSAQVFRTLVLSLLVLGLWALIGLGAGILIPNQVAALLIAVGVAWIVEPIAGLAIKQWDFGREHIAPYLPSEASQAVINTALASADDVRLSWWGGAIVLVVWAAAFAGVGIVRVVRQDISDLLGCPPRSRPAAGAPAPSRALGSSRSRNGSPSPYARLGDRRCADPQEVRGEAVGRRESRPSPLPGPRCARARRAAGRRRRRQREGTPASSRS